MKYQNIQLSNKQLDENMEHIKTHYYGSHSTINPNGIVALGPLVS